MDKNPYLSESLFEEEIKKIPKGVPMIPGGSCITVRMITAKTKKEKDDGRS